MTYSEQLPRILSIGTFDLFHDGHHKLLVRAAGFGNLYVGVNSDRFVEDYKGRAPALTESLRMENVENHWAVERVFLNDGPGFDLIRRVKPHFLAIGSDWHDRYLPQIGMTPEALFDELSCGVIYLPRTPKISTTELRSDAA